LHFQQRRGTILAHPNKVDEQDEWESSEPLQKNKSNGAEWKLALVDPVLQTQLGVSTGDTIILRNDMSSRGIALKVSSDNHIPDLGLGIIRVSPLAMDLLAIESGKEMLCEGWEQIKASEISFRYFIQGRLLAQQGVSFMTPELENCLRSRISQELASVPLARHDLFETEILLTGHEEAIKIRYFVRAMKPRFAITNLTVRTSVILTNSYDLFARGAGQSSMVTS